MVSFDNSIFALFERADEKSKIKCIAQKIKKLLNQKIKKVLSEKESSYFGGKNV